MAKIRIYELAKELGIEDNKELVAYVRGLGLEIKGVMSTLDDDQAEMVRRKFSTAPADRSAGSSGASKPSAPRPAATISKPAAPAPTPAASTPAAPPAVPIRRRATGMRPAEKEREKEREREEAERVPEEVVRRPAEDVRRPVEPVRRPEVRRRPEGETGRPSTDAPKAAGATAPVEGRRAPGPSGGSMSPSEAASDAARVEPGLPPRVEPQVG